MPETKEPSLPVNPAEVNPEQAFKDLMCIPVRPQDLLTRLKELSGQQGDEMRQTVGLDETEETPEK